jgi:sigma-B regulation protein RsbU (phosphoserine phosphatase)
MVRDGEGRPYRMVGSHQDITVQKLAERKLGQREASLIAAQRIMNHLRPAGPLDSREFLIRGACYAADYVPGDYFNVFHLPDGSILAVVADVSGHGLEAALLVTLIHGFLRANAGLPMKLDEMSERINRVLFEETEGDGFCTMLLALIDPQSRSLVYLNAGHPRALIFDRSGNVVTSLDSLALPLGIFPTAEFPIAGPLSLDAGSLVVLYTDGVIEASGPDMAQFGIDRLQAAVRERLDSPPEMIIEHVHVKIREFKGTKELLDDVTIVLIKVP